MKMSKIIVFAIVFSLILLNSIAVSEETSNVLYVDDDGTADYTSIQDAIDASSNGDTIFVYNGVYYENLIINKSIKLIGSNQTTIVANNTVGILTVVWITPEAQSDVYFCNFIIKYATKYEYTVGISCSCVNSTIKNCRIENCGYGITLSSANNYINNCNFYNNTYGLYLSEDFTNVSECYFENNTQSGLYISSGSYCTIKKCTFLKNYNGIKIQSAFYVSISESQPPPSDYAIENTIYLCNFVDNELHTKTHLTFSNYWDNGTVGNYWDDYNGTDKNNDGIGDTPYNISSNIQDKYPLMNPYHGRIIIDGFYIDESSVQFMLLIGMIVTIIFCIPIGLWWRKKYFK